MSGLMGSLEAISTVFDSTDPKDIRQGIKECINNEGKILSAEEKRREESQKVTIQEELDAVTLTEEIRSDMGEEIMTKDIEEQDRER